MVESVSETEGPIATDGGGRSCGGCTACCEGWLHDTRMNLSVGKGCPHISPMGCGIYEDRPEIPCRGFRCAWLDEPSMFSDDMRPDKFGAIVVTNRDWYEWKVVRAFPTAAAVPPETVQRLVALAKPQQLPVIFYEHHFEEGQFAGTFEKALGPPKFAEEVKRRPSDRDVFRR